jgi:tRNA threonylcarbamoyl adenosine modification protein YjeE
MHAPRDQTLRSAELQLLLQQTEHGPMSLTQMAAWGRAFALALPPGAVVALHGDLGAGKTTLVRVMCEALGVRDLSQVTSPTFAIVHEYESASGLVVHADLYRLRREHELDQLGWDELVSRAARVFVEWPERAGAMLPPDAWHLQLSHVASESDKRAVHVML